MYKSFFGLRENPFNVNPDPRFLHRTPRIQEALEQLTYGVQNRKGLILLTGEVGTGKTTLINYLLDWLHQQNMPTAFIFNSHLSVDHLFDFILNDFGIPIDFRLRGNMLLQLNQWLLERFHAGTAPVLIVDEAHGLSFELLEEIRLLLNLETASEKLLQVVLVGQPELEDKLKRPQMRQLRQRIALRCNTAPLNLDESHGYIADRLRIAGASREPVFESDAVEALHYYSRGIPRVMNLLCEHALINAYVEELNPVPPQMVEEAARDFLMDDFRPLPGYPGTATRVDAKLSVMHSEFANEPRRPSACEAAPPQEESAAERIPAPSACALEEPALNGASRIVAAVSERQAHAVSEDNLPFSTRDLLPALPGLQSQPGASTNSLDATASQSDCAAELVATMERMLEAATSHSRPRLDFPKVKNELSPTANRNQTAASKNRLFSLATMNRFPDSSARTRISGLPSWKESYSSGRALLGPVFSPATWSGLLVGVRLKLRGPASEAQVLLRQWKIEFRRDWMAMINAFGLPKIAKSLMHWLREPVSSKSMASGKNQTV